MTIIILIHTSLMKIYKFYSLNSLKGAHAHHMYSFASFLPVAGCCKVNLHPYLLEGVSVQEFCGE